jgi:hypothetical protein
MSAAVATDAAIHLFAEEPNITALALRGPRPQVLWRAPEFWNVNGTFRPTAIAEGVSTAQENVSPVESHLTQADLTTAQLLRMERWDFDWDGSEAAKPLPFSLKDARAFIRALAPESVMPRPALHADGHAILFVRGPDKYAELEFLGNQRIGFYARQGGQEWTDEIEFDGRTLPEGLSRIGFAV